MEEEDNDNDMEEEDNDNDALGSRMSLISPSYGVFKVAQEAHLG